MEKQEYGENNQSGYVGQETGTGTANPAGQERGAGVANPVRPEMGAETTNLIGQEIETGTSKQVGQETRMGIPNRTGESSGDSGQGSDESGRSQEGSSDGSVQNPDENRQSSGQTYGLDDQELIRLLVKSRMEQKQSLEYEDLDGYEMPPRTQFSMLKKPAVSIKYGKMSFNMACIRLFEGVQYILPLCHPQKRRLTVVMCHEEESASVDWARIRRKDGVWVNKDVTSLEYIDKLYKMMNWNRSCRYKVLGRVANSREGLVLVFELDEAVMFESKALEYVDEETGETVTKKKQVKYYPEMYKDRVGKSYNDYAAARQINMFEYLEEYLGKTYSDHDNDAGESGADSVPAAETNYYSVDAESGAKQDTGINESNSDDSAVEMGRSSGNSSDSHVKGSKYGGTQMSFDVGT